MFTRYSVTLAILLWTNRAVHCDNTTTNQDPLSVLKQYYIDHEMIRDSKIRTADKILKSYDFVIIGGGSGGSVMANRLTEMTDWRVLLLEAGEQTGFLADVPLLASMPVETSNDWKLRPELETASCLETRGLCSIPRGKALGGTSVLNTNVYSRGNRKNFDDWFVAGNPGWSYKTALKYFKKSEDIQISDLKKKRKGKNPSVYHGTKGYLSVAYSGFETPFSVAFRKAGLELGYDTVDYNGKDQSGFARIQSIIKNGRRCSAARCYLKPASLRKNLAIVTSALATKILINKDDKNVTTAYGVEFTRNGTDYKVRARKEVILSAGVFNSPQLLMLSGLGPKNHLKKFGVPVLKNLQVGRRLLDHPVMPIRFDVNTSGLSVKSEVLQSLDDISDYFQRGIGPLTMSAGAESLAFVNTDRGGDANVTGVPNLELLESASEIDPDRYTKYYESQEENAKREFPKDDKDSHGGGDFFVIRAVVLRPKSVGRVKLQSADPGVQPKITLNFLHDPKDVEALRDGVKLAVKVSRTKAFAKFNTTLNPTPYPGCEHEVFESDEYWECAIRQVASTLHHQVGTCKMGPASDQFAVVDARLRVYGIKALRVVDASIMPTIPAAHTNAVVYMIAEKAADMVKEDWGVL